MLSNHLILCHHLLLLPSIFPMIGIFSNDSTLCIRLPKYWNFSFSISLSNEYSGLISFRTDCPCSPKDSQESYPAPQFKSISSLAFILLYGPSLTSIHDYWKNYRFDYMYLCQQNDVLLFNMLSKFVIAFLPRRKHLLISWLQSPSTVDFGAKENKICHCFHFSLWFMMLSIFPCACWPFVYLPWWSICSNILLTFNWDVCLLLLGYEFCIY